MKNSIKNFLLFNGTNLVFKTIDGKYYVAVKPICDALGVSYRAQYRKLTTDPYWKSRYSKETFIYPDGQPRSAICLEQGRAYLWISSINSDNKALMAYKEECCEALLQRFQGTLAGEESELRTKKAIAESYRDKAKSSCIKYPEFLAYLEKENEVAALGRALKNLEKKEVNHLKGTMFGDDDFDK